MNGHLLSHKCPPLPAKNQRVLRKRRKRTIGARGQGGSLWEVTFWKWQGHCTWTHTDVAICTGQNSIMNWGEAHKAPALSKKLLEVKGCFGRDSLLWGLLTERLSHIHTHTAAPIGLSFLCKKHKTRDWRDAMAIKSTHCSLEGSGSTQRLHKAAHNCKPARDSGLSRYMYATLISHRT